jgi:hypothetical protein
MLMGFSLTAHAEISPSAKPVEEQEEEEEIPSSPKTGESEVLVCSMMTMCICAGVVTVALRKTR